jgi:transcriptional regulator with XRE-family HTH domain
MQSNISKSYKKELLGNLKNKKYRDAFVESHIKNGIPFQIKTMRERRDLTQEELGVLANMKQAAISRLENPNYGNFTLKTLKEIASAFDVALTVRFVPFSDLVKWDLALDADSLEAPSFNKDPYFLKGGVEVTSISDTNQYKEIIPTSTSNKVVNIKDHKPKTISIILQAQVLEMGTLASY